MEAPSKLPTDIQRTALSFLLEVSREKGSPIVEVSGDVFADACGFRKKNLVRFVDGLEVFGLARIGPSRYDVSRVERGHLDAPAAADDEIAKIIMRRNRIKAAKYEPIDIPDGYRSPAVEDDCPEWLDRVLGHWPHKSHPQCYDGFWVRPDEDEDPTWDDASSWLQENIKTEYQFRIILEAMAGYRAEWWKRGGNVYYVKHLGKFIGNWSKYVNEASRQSVLLRYAFAS